MSIDTSISNTAHAPSGRIPTGTYVVDPAHTRIGFVARHAMVTKVRGSFNEFTGTGYFDADDPTASHLELTIQAASIDTRNADRDAHIRSSDFLAIEEHPTLEFVSTSIEPLDVRCRVIGVLTMRGVSREVVVDFEVSGLIDDPDGAGLRLGFEGVAVINRKDWGVSWNSNLDAGGVLVSDKIVLELDVSAVRQAS